MFQVTITLCLVLLSVQSFTSDTQSEQMFNTSQNISTLESNICCPQQTISQQVANICDLSQNSLTRVSNICSAEQNGLQRADEEAYEGAGFLLRYQRLGVFVLGIRVKKPEDILKDSSIEVEYMGGKVEPEDGGCSLKTAVNEMYEELGSPVNIDFSKITPIPYFNVISGKWIRCFLLDMTDEMFWQVAKIDSVHDQWNVTEFRDISGVTGRPEKVRKAISAFVTVAEEDFIEYVETFAGGTSLSDAKKHKTIAKPLIVKRICSGEQSEHYLRAFNLLIFKKHIQQLRQQRNGVK